MAKTRVYALAKELGLESAKLVEILESLGVTVRSHASSIEDSTAAAVRELVGEPKVPAGAEVAAGGRAEAVATAEAPATAAEAVAVEVIPAGPARRAETGARPPGAIPVPPVVTVMGHVDHGKTTLLDKIRQTDVTSTEFGGITQHIGASEITSEDGRRIVFLDTPGHEAFTAMRARGAQVTDIAVIVVAADDGVMPQTIEAINHVKAAEVPMIVAINKMDLPDANADRVKQQLSDRGVVPEDWGGETVCVPVSAETGDGLKDLLDMILLVADVRELWADPQAPLSGFVIEAKLDRSRGPVATVLVRRGTLRRGDAILCGTVPGRVRAMTNWRGETVQEALPGTPVEVVGLEATPDAGDDVEGCASLKEARERAGQRRAEAREGELEAAARISLETLLQAQPEGEVKALNLIIKGDAWGSVEAISEALQRLNRDFDEVQLEILSAGVGPVNESDVALAVASDAVVLGFHSEPDEAARRMAEQEGVQIRTYRVIYEAIDDIRRAMTGMLEPVYREVTIGTAQVRQLFRISRQVVAGCRVVEGVVRRGASVRIRRNGQVVHEGQLVSLRHVKNDVHEMAAGSECGIMVSDFRDFEEGDLIECVIEEEVPRA